MFHEFNIVTGNADKIKIAISQRLVEILDKYLKIKNKSYHERRFTKTLSTMATD